MPRGSLRGARPCRQAAAWPEARGDPARREMAAGPRAGAGGGTRSNTRAGAKGLMPLLPLRLD